jgi:hypothetical protein
LAQNLLQEFLRIHRSFFKKIVSPFIFFVSFEANIAAAINQSTNEGRIARQSIIGQNKNGQSSIGQKKNRARRGIFKLNRVQIAEFFSEIRRSRNWLLKTAIDCDKNVPRKKNWSLETKFSDGEH